jgi:hypothetical protein
MSMSRLTGFGAMGVIVATLGACSSTPPPATAPSAAAPSAGAPSTAAPTTAAPVERPATMVATEPTTVTPARTTEAPTSDPTVESDLSQLKKLGITTGSSVLIDVADDGADRFLQVGKNGVVDFTGTTSTDSTMMALKPAPVAPSNRVVIKPPFWNEDLGAGSCVADTAGAALKLETCRPGKASQVWQVIPAGDSGQFELRGTFGILSVGNGKLVTAGGRTGLQTKQF